MKNYFKLFIIIAVILTSYFVFSRFKSISEIPEFEYKSLNNKIFSNKNLIKSDKNIAFVYFSCKFGDCKDLMNNFNNYKKLQIRNQFVLITTEKDINIIKDFVDYKNFNKLNIPILVDTKNNFPTDFALGISINLPKIIIFDNNEKLLNENNSIDLLNSLKL